MITGSRDTATTLVVFAVLLGLIVVGQPLLVPLVFSLLLWAVLNALADLLMRAKFPRWLAWAGSVTVFACALYMFARIMGDQAAGLAAATPAYAKKLQDIVTQLLAPLHIHPNLRELFSASDVAGFLGSAAASVGSSLFAFLQILIYVGFLLAEQGQMAIKFAQIQTDAERHSESLAVIRAIARQVQSYLGITTVLSAIMALATYVLLEIMGVEFAGFWALVLFVVTYIPTIGAAGVVLPALMALVQYGSFLDAILIIAILGLIHFLLMSVAETVILGQTLNLSPFAIIVALTFWGLVWGAAGLFLAVPVTGAIAIVCGHLDGLKWVSVLLAAPPPHVRKKHKASLAA